MIIKKIDGQLVVGMLYTFQTCCYYCFV